MRLGRIDVSLDESHVFMVLFLHRGGYSILMQWRRWHLPEFFWPGQVGFYAVEDEEANDGQE